MSVLGGEEHKKMKGSKKLKKKKWPGTASKNREVSKAKPENWSQGIKIIYVAV